MDWNINQTVTITGQDDTTEDGDITYNIIFYNSVSSDANYNGITIDNFTLVNKDDDSPNTPGYYITLPSNDTDENGVSAYFSIRLRAPPLFDNVTLTLESTDPTEGRITKYTPPGFSPTTDNKTYLYFSKINCIFC